MKHILTSVLVIAGMMPAMAADYLEIPTVEIEPGHTATLVINLENETKLTGFQMDLVIPEGITITEDEYGDADVSFASGRAADHTISVNYRNANTLAISAFSGKSRDFKGSSGPFLEMEITASADFSGSHEVRATNVMFATPDGVECPFPDAVGYIVARVDVTGIAVEPSSVSITVGEVKQLEATVTPAGATGAEVTWSTSNGSVVAVDGTGKITGVAEGTAVVTATCGAFSATCNVTVVSAVCATPEIAVNGEGNLVVSCPTEGAEIHTTITCPDIDTFVTTSGEPITLTGQYLITSYASVAGKADSEPTTAVLVWAKKYEAPTGVELLEAPADRALLIRADGDNIAISGTTNGEPVAVYGIGGTQIYSGTATEGVFVIPVTLTKGTVYVIAVGGRSAKFAF